MARQSRIAPGGVVYHVLNRGVARLPLFYKPEDYDAFERVLAMALARHPLRLLAYCLMPNHWHLVLWPREDGQLTAFVRWLTHTHSMRWHAHFHRQGTGHLYQGRFKSFPVETDGHFLTVCRYVKRNALRAKLVERAEDWRWGSLWRRERAGVEERGTLAEWPVERPSDWVEWVNRAETNAECEAVRQAVARGTPFGGESWREAMADRLGLQNTLRPPGRPRKELVEEGKETKRRRSGENL